MMREISEESLILSVAFGVQDAPVPTTSMPKPEALHATMGDNPGEIDAGCHAVTKAKSYIFEVREHSDTEAPGSWTQAKIVSRSFATIGGSSTASATHSASVPSARMIWKAHGAMKWSVWPPEKWRKTTASHANGKGATPVLPAFFSMSTRWSSVKKIKMFGSASGSEGGTACAKAECRPRRASDASRGRCFMAAVMVGFMVYLGIAEWGLCDTTGGEVFFRLWGNVSKVLFPPYPQGFSPELPPSLGRYRRG